MAKQLNIDLSVKADTSQAKQAMLELQKNLDAILTTRTITINDASINGAKQAAMDLKRHLDAAVNTNTGKLDLSKFSASLNKSGQSLQGLYNQLSQIGPQGQQAFLSLSQSMAKADMSAISLGSKLGGLTTTLKNTAKWQISSSLLHGLMGAVQGAYGYAQDLNESLNNIRIVTGHNTEEMAKFAKEANASAQALSTTTTAYTDASLIYYQQGLSDDEVKARTDATIKLANVSRQSAEEVSSQMTAIWNNFADGNDNLEYYEDVITKLGASTASSSSEIAEGLQKFAAVADTVDLSYEKSSAALATVVAETRQSADTVGTAFKTIFARLEGLNLGETLDDGTTLNKYSSALKKIGVNIKDSSGEMKTMDNILDEMGEKWQSLSKDQQIATAQTVAGVRQYTQFISLMDNYDKVQKNEDIAKNSKGTVDEQAKIYAESWEAARDRVTAAAEEIYSQLLNDQAFIEMLNGFEQFLGVISNVIEGLGGLKGVLLLISSIFMQHYAKEMPGFIEKMIANVRVLTGVEEQRRQAMLKQNAEIINNQMEKSGSAEVDAQIAGYKKISVMYADLASKRSRLSEAEIANYENLIKEAEARTQIAQAIGKEIDEIKRESQILETSLRGEMGYSNSKNSLTDTIQKDSFQGDAQAVTEGAKIGLEDEERRLDILQKQAEEYKKIQNIKNLHGENNLTKEQKQTLQSLKAQHGSLKDLHTKIQGITNDVAKMRKGMTGADLFKAFKNGAVELGKTQGILNHVNDKMSVWQQKMKDIGKDPEKLKALKNEMSAYADKLEESGLNVDAVRESIDKLSRTGKVGIEDVFNSFKNLGEEGIALSAERLEQLKIALNNLGMDPTKLEQLMLKLQQGAQLTEEERAELERMAQQLDDLPNHGMKASEVFTKLGSTLMQVAMVWNSFKNLGNIWTNDDLDAGEKIVQTLMTLGTIIPALISMYELLFVAKNKDTGATLAGAIASGAKAAADAIATAAQWALNAAMDANPIGAVILAIMALIAILAALVVGIMQVVGAGNEQEKALKAEQKTAEELKNIYDDLKNKYEELKQSISDYNNALNAIKKLTKGTLEWKDAVREANEQAMKLIQTYKLIKGKDYTIDEDGIIQISNETQKRVVEEQSDNLTTVQTAQMESEKRVAEAETDKAKADAQKNLGAFVDKDDTLDKLEEYITKGGYLEKYQSGEMTAKAIWKEIQENNNLANSTFLGNQDAGKSMEKVLDYVGKKEVEKDTTKQANEAIGTTYASQDPNVQASKNKEALEKAAGRVYEQVSDENYDDITDKIKNATDEQKKEYAKQYAKISGLDQLKGYEFDHMDSEDGMIHYKYINEDGDEKDGQVSGKTVKTVLASSDNQADMAEILQQLDTTITKLQLSAEQTNNKGDKAIASMLSSQDLGTANKTEADSFVSESGGEEGSYDDMKAYLENRLGLDELTDEEAKKLGFESAKAMIESFQEQRDGVKKEWDAVTENLGEAGLKDFEKLSLDSAKKVSAAFDKIKLGGNGDQAVKDLSKELNGLVANLPEEDRLKALEELGSIDWTSWDAMDQAKNVLAKFNVTVDEGSSSWKNLTNEIRTATGAMPDAAAEMEKLKKVIIATNKLEKGKTVDAETYETLINQTKAWEKYFQVQADGTYKFIGNAEEMKKANAETFAENKKSLEEFEKLQGKFKQVTFTDNEGKVQPIDWGNASGSTSAAQYLSKNADNQNVQAVLNKYGWSKEKLDKTIAAAQETTTNEKGEKVLTEEAKKAQESLNALYGNIDKLSKTNYENEKERQDDIYASTADTYEKLARLKNDISQKAYDKQVEVIKQEALAAAESLEELDKAMSYVEQNGATVTFEDQYNALTKLASQYSNTTKELKDYNDAIANIQSSDGGKSMTEESQEALAEATDKLRAAIAAGEAASKYSLDADAIEAQAKAIKKVNQDIGMTAEQATKLAIANQRMNAGIKELNENFEDWKKTLKTADKTSMDYAEAAAKTTSAIKNLLGVSDEWELPDEFLDSVEHLEWLTQAANGSEQAINKIGLASAKAALQAEEADEAIITAYNDMIKTGKITGELIKVDDFGTARDEVINGIDDIQNHLNELLNGSLTLDDVIDTESFVKSLNEVALTTGMTVDEMNDTLNSIGVQAQVETVSIPKRISVPTYKEYKKWHNEPSPGKTTYTDATGTHEIQDPPDGYYETYTVPGPTYEVDGYEQIAQISTAENPIKPNVLSSTISNPNYVGVGGTSNRGSTNRGGGVSKSSTTKSDTSSKSDSSSDSDNKTTSAASHEHEVHRYSNEENALNSLVKQYERLNKAKDKAFGAGRIAYMEQELKQLKELKKEVGNYLDSIAGKGSASKIAKALLSGQDIGALVASGALGGAISDDYKALFSGRSASGKNVEYVTKDANGNERLTSAEYSLGAFNQLFGSNLQIKLDSSGHIQNKDALLKSVENMGNAEEDAFSDLKDPSYQSQNEHALRQAYIKEFKERISQFDESIDKLTEMGDEYLEYISKIQEKNGEIIIAKMENGVNLGKKTMQKIERSLKILGDSIYRSAEAMQKWYNATFKEGVEADKKEADIAIKQFLEAQKGLELYQADPLNEDAISPEAAAEAFEKAEEILDNKISNLLTKIETGFGLLGNTLEEWNTVLNNVTTSIENNIKILNHFQTILSLLGQTMNYGKMNILLTGEAEAAEKNYYQLKRQAEDAEKVYKEAERGMIGLSGENLRQYKETTLKAAYTDWQEKTDAMYTGLESWMQIENAKFENRVNQIFAKTEEKLTGEWGSFDALDKAMSRQKAITDEYLTKTNQLYETNKLMRQLSQEIDKTDSSIAKSKLKAFSDEIKLLQEQEKLSKTDLDIAKARYEVLQAELALEEAKNAKTTVRLQRDSEGNYGYIYTADQDKVTNAEQVLEDKQNALYNLGLQKAQEYGEKIISIRKEWQAEVDTLIDDWYSGKITDEKIFNARLEDINQKYRDLESSYLDSFITSNNLLNEVGAEGQTESWVNSFSEIIKEHRLFNADSEAEANGYNSTIRNLAEETTNKLLSAMSNLSEKNKFFEKEAELSNSQIRRSVGEVTNEVSKLANEVTKKGGLADAMSIATAKAQQLTNEFLKQIDSLREQITYYEQLANKMHEAYIKAADLVNVQVAYNHAKNGATSVSWGPNGVVYDYSNKNTNNNGSSSGDSSGSSRNPQPETKKVAQRYVPYNNTYHTVYWSDNTTSREKHLFDGDAYCVKCNLFRYKKTNAPVDKKGRVEIFDAQQNRTFRVDDNDFNRELFHYSLKSGGYTGTWPSSGKTGMYTGSWNGPDLEENGKLAFLHQKELVLNASDTENMLEAVKLIRQISQQIDLQAVSQSSGFALAATQFYGDREPLQQDITIHAEFPNATNHNEIEEAFINLANKASQYAYRS